MQACTFPLSTAPTLTSQVSLPLFSFSFHVLPAFSFHLQPFTLIEPLEAFCLIILQDAGPN
jgi:hypothetical protein